MKNLSNINLAVFCCVTSVLLWSSCQKMNQSSSRNSVGTNSLTAFSSHQAVVVAVKSGDTIYVVNVCQPGLIADTVAFSLLPDSISTYLTANYSGYTFKKAYKILNSAKTVQGYVVTILYNGNPVGLKFNATGGFVSVLEQREAPDLNGRGWHEGGFFGNRDNLHRDTIALTALPTAVKTYFTTNYPSDTLKHSLINRDSSYVVVSADNGIFVTEFTSAGTFIKRVQVYPHVVTSTTLTQAELPANVSSYLTTTYPAYVFDNSIDVKLNGSIQAYFVFIDANSTKYLVQFDSGGNFVRSYTLR